MCIDPMTLGIGLTALQGVSAISSTNQQAKAQQAYYDAQAQAAEQNADMLPVSAVIWVQLLTLVIRALEHIEKTVISF